MRLRFFFYFFYNGTFVLCRNLPLAELIARIRASSFHTGFFQQHVRVNHRSRVGRTGCRVHRCAWKRRNSERCNTVVWHDCVHCAPAHGLLNSRILVSVQAWKHVLRLSVSPCAEQNVLNQRFSNQYSVVVSYRCTCCSFHFESKSLVSLSFSEWFSLRSMLSRSCWLFATADRTFLFSPISSNQFPAKIPHDFELKQCFRFINLYFANPLVYESRWGLARINVRVNLVDFP